VPTRDVVLIGKPGCHLCDDARIVIREVVDSLGADGPLINFEERSILDDAELHARFVDDIPVVLVDGRVHTFWRVDAERLRTALLTTVTRGD
jgi:hypothetical protein